jgi:hypothetical protein
LHAAVGVGEAVVAGKVAAAEALVVRLQVIGADNHLVQLASRFRRPQLTTKALMPPACAFNTAWWKTTARV